MAVFPSFKLTEKGEELLNRSIGEGKTLTFTKFEIGNGDTPSDFRKQTGLVNKFYEFPILNTSIQKDQVLRIKGYFDNKSFSEDKQLKEIGVYVRLEGIDIDYLYSYTNAGDTGDIIPASSRGFYSRTLDVANYIGYATDITFNIEQLRDRYAFNTENEMKVASYLKTGDKVELWGNLVLGDKPTDEYIIQESGDVELSNGLFAKKVSFKYIAQTIEEIQKLALKVGDIVELLGYYTAGDGAGHQRIIASEDDGSGVQLGNGLWANRIIDGKFEVYTEKDLEFAFAKKLRSIIIMRDLMITKKKIFDNFESLVDFNNKLIRFDSAFSDTAFIEINENQTTATKQLQAFAFQNLNIDFSGTDNIVNVFKVGFMFRTGFEHFNIKNLKGTLFDYFLDERCGAEVKLYDITMRSADIVGNVGLKVQWSDSSIINVFPVGFTYGVIATSGHNQFINCHPWGYPAEYSEGQKMYICIQELSTNTWTNCIADTPEVKDKSQAPSFENGGIGFYKKGAYGKYVGCSVVAHPSSNPNSIIGFYLENGFGASYVNCKMNYPEGKPSVYMDFVATSNSTFTLIGCDFINGKKSIERTNQFVTKTRFENPPVFNMKNYEDSFLFQGDYFLSLYKDKRVFGNIKLRDKDNNDVYFLIPRYFGDVLNSSILEAKKTELITLDDEIGSRLLYFAYNEGTSIIPIFWNKILKEFTKSDGTVIGQLNATLLNTPYHINLMEQEGGTTKKDFYTYLGEKFAYDAQVRAEEQAKQEAYNLALQNNPNLTWEEFEAQYSNSSMMNLSLVERLEEPTIPESVVKFMEKYL